MGSLCSASRSSLWMAEARARSWGDPQWGFPVGSPFQREGLFSLETKVLGTE